MDRFTSREARVSSTSSFLDKLPGELCLLILSFLDLRSLGRAAQVSQLACALSFGVSLVEVTLPATIVGCTALREALRVRLLCTSALKITNSRSGLPRHAGKFCKLGVHQEDRSACVSLCGSLLDGGARFILGAVGSALRVLDLTASGHLTCRSIVNVLSTCLQLEQLLCCSCWHIMAQLAVADIEHVAPCRALSLVDLSHTDTVDTDLRALLKLVPKLVDLQVNFCEQLTDSWLDELPGSLLRWAYDLA